MPVTPTRVHKLMPLRGRKTSQPADTIGDEFSPNALNVRFRFGEIRPTPGRDLLAGPSIAEQVLYIGQFPLLSGAIWIIKLTQSKMYRWGAGSPGNPRQWHEVLPTGTPMSGTTARWSVAIGEDKFFFAREGDPIFYWDGLSTSGYTQLVATSGTVPKAKFIEYFNDRLVAGFTFEGVNIFANRVRWAERGNSFRWDSTLQQGAGFLDFAEEQQEPIRGLKSVNDKLAVYTRRSIKEMAPTGALDPVFTSATRARGVGCDAPYTIANAGQGQQQFFLGFDRNVYTWDGIEPTPIGGPIYEEIHDLTFANKLDKYFAFVSLHRQEYWLILDTGDAFVYDYARDNWSRDTVPALTAAAEVEDTSPEETWATITTTWDTETRTWSEFEGTQFTVIFGGRANGSTAIIDESVSYDYFSIGSIIDRFVETPDFYFPDRHLGNVLRLMLVYEYANAEPYVVNVSFDRGITWSPDRLITPIMAGINWVEFNYTGPTVRFRFRENNANGQFRWRSYSYDYIDSGEFIGTTTA